MKEKNCRTCVYIHIHIHVSTGHESTKLDAKHCKAPRLTAADNSSLRGAFQFRGPRGGMGPNPLKYATATTTPLGVCPIPPSSLPKVSGITSTYLTIQGLRVLRVYHQCVQALQAQLPPILQPHPLLSQRLQLVAAAALRRAVHTVGGAVLILPKRILPPLDAAVSPRGDEVAAHAAP